MIAVIHMYLHISLLVPVPSSEVELVKGFAEQGECIEAGVPCLISIVDVTMMRPCARTRGEAFTYYFSVRFVFLVRRVYGVRSRAVGGDPKIFT